MGTIVSPSGASCNVTASDAAINNVPNLRTFLSKSLDVAAKAKKPIAQAEQILNKQITTIATNPQRYTPAAIQQCTVNLEKSAQNASNVDVLESLTNTGYMPPESTTYSSALYQAVQTGTAYIEPIASDTYGTVYEGKLHFPGEGAFEFQQGRRILNASEGLPIGRTGTQPQSPRLSGNKQPLKYDPEAPFTTTVGSPSIGGPEGLADISVKVGSDNKVQPVENINELVHIYSSGGPTAFSQLAGALAFSYLAPGLGSVIGESLGAAGIAVSNEAATAIARAGINIAGGQDPTTAIRDAITGAIIDTGSRDIAGEIQKGVQAMSDDKYMALLIGGAIGSAFSSAAKTAAKGGSSQDILNAAVAGAAGSGVATETESRTLGQAVAGGLTGGTQGAVMGAATALGTGAAKGGATTTPGGVPLPPGGKVGVAFSVDNAGNALVMYQDGTTANVQVDSSVQPGAAIAVDTTTNKGTVTGMAPFAGAGTQTAEAPYRIELRGMAMPDEPTTSTGVQSTTAGRFELPEVPAGGQPLSYVPTISADGSVPPPSTEEIISGETPEPVTTSGTPTPGTPAFLSSFPTFDQVQYGFPTPNPPAFISNIGPDLAYTEAAPQGKQIPDQIGQVSGGGVGGQETSGVVYPNIVDITAGYPYKIGQGLDAGAGGTGTRDQQIMDLTGIGGEGGVSSEGPGAEEIATLPEIEVTPTPLEEELISDVPPEKTAEEPRAGKEPSPYLISGGISPRMKARAPGRAAATALQTPFERSLITSGLTSYRGAGEIESPETGGKRTTAWNEASLRLKDALGI